MLSSRIFRVCLSPCYDKREERFMSTATWGELDASAYKMYPANLLKYLLYQMMTQFSANGACLALYNEGKKQMEVQLHVRLRNAASLPLHSGVASEEERISRRRSTID